MKSALSRLLIFTLLVVLAAPALAVTVTRGPYLQMGTDASMTLRWRTDLPVPSVVEFGEVEGLLDRTQMEATPKTSHEITVGGLDPATKYWYAVGDGTNRLSGGDADTWFRSSPATGTEAPLRIWVLGDSGLPGPDQLAVRDAYLARTEVETDLVLMLGDNAYASGTDSEFQSGLFDPYGQTLRNAVLWPARGNHDEVHVGDANDYFEFFTLPTAAECGGIASGTESWFSFDVGNVHFICFDSYLGGLSMPSPMLDWIVADLAANDLEWTVVFTHYPPYSKGSHDSDALWHSGQLRDHFLEVLEAGGVDLFLSGHSHGYERSYLLDGHYGDSTTFSPVHQVDDGDGYYYGNGAYHKPSHGPAPHEGTVYVVAGSASRTNAGSFDHPAMFRARETLGSFALTIDGSRLDAEFITASGYVYDRFSIIKGEQVAAPAAVSAGQPLVRPNPFEGSTTVRFRLARPGSWSVDIYDLAGRRVRTMGGDGAAGEVVVPFDGRDFAGSDLASGIYLYRVRADGVTRPGRMSLVR